MYMKETGVELSNSKVWISNFVKECLPQVKACADYVKLKYFICDEAYNINGILLENMFSMYVSQDETDEKINAFFATYRQVSNEYKQQLIAMGYATEKELEGKPVFLGCEKIYFPERWG